MDNHDPNILTVKEAALFLNVHIETVRRLARQGKIPSFKVGKDWRFRRDVLMRWSENYTPPEQRNYVLIIDDDEQVCRLLRRFLEADGFTAHIVRSGKDGLRYIDEAVYPPGVIILDLMMPEMNGPEFLKRLRERYPDLPVVIVTAYPEGDLMHEATKYSPLMLIAKPVDRQKLRTTVAIALAAPKNNVLSMSSSS